MSYNPQHRATANDPGRTRGPFRAEPASYRPSRILYTAEPVSYSNDTGRYHGPFTAEPLSYTDDTSRRSHGISNAEHRSYSSDPGYPPRAFFAAEPVSYASEREPSRPSRALITADPVSYFNERGRPSRRVSDAETVSYSSEPVRPPRNPSRSRSGSRSGSISRGVSTVDRGSYSNEPPVRPSRSSVKPLFIDVEPAEVLRPSESSPRSSVGPWSDSASTARYNQSGCASSVPSGSTTPVSSEHPHKYEPQHKQSMSSLRTASTAYEHAVKYGPQLSQLPFQKDAGVYDHRKHGPVSYNVHKETESCAINDEKTPIPFAPEFLDKVELEKNENPLMWPNDRKWLNVFVISCIGFLAPLGSSIIVPATYEMAHDFNISNTTVQMLPVSLYVFGLGLGPFILAPLSEVIGRYKVYVISAVVYLAFNVASALAGNTTNMCILRFFAGISGSTGPSLGSSTIGDLFEPKERGKAASMYSLGPLLGPILGNVIGAWIVERTGWRWTLWVLTIGSGVIGAIMVFTLSESYAPFLKQAKFDRLQAAERTLRGETVDGWRTTQKLKELAPKVKLAIRRPVKLFFTSPIVCIFSLYQAYIYGLVYLAFTTFPLLFQASAAHPSLPNYGWSPGISGLTFLGMGLGCFIAAIANGIAQNKLYAHLTARDLNRMRIAELEAGVPPHVVAAKKKPFRGKPEYRLPLINVGMVLMAVGLFWFGWAAQAKTFWFVPLMGSFVMGVGVVLVFQCAQIYLVDALIPFSASAVAVSVLCRSAVGAAFPLFGERLYITLGFGWGNTVLGFAALAGLPFSIYVVLYGESLRKRFPFRG